jgi:serine/threonine-protein kinase
MSQPKRINPPQDAKLQELIAAFLEAVQSGQLPDRRKLFEQNPDLAEELESFFANHDRLMVVARASGHADGSDRAEDAKMAGPHQATSDGGENPLLAATKSWTDKTIQYAHGPTMEQSAGDVQRIGGYELLEEIGRGGMGVVYKARQVGLNRTVALKMIKSGHLAGEEEVARFRAEAASAGRLDHPGIVPIYEVGQWCGLPYFSMGYVEGESLAAKIANGPLPPRQAALLTMKIASAVDYAHQRGVIHRDLKPANVLVDASGQPKITDFGLAKSATGAAQLTTTGQILGTPNFMPPEQASGRRESINELADVYGLGAILFALCVGRAPFQAASQLDVVLQVLDRPPTPPSTLNRAVPKSLEQICLRCLEKRPEDRYASASALADDLARFLKDEPIEAHRMGLWHKLRRWGRREPALVAHLGAIVIALLIVLIVHWTLRDNPAYAYRHAGALSAWALTSLALQQGMHVPRWAVWARWAWALVDVVFFTVILYMAEPPRGPLLVGYPLVIAAAGLFFQVRFVAFATVISVVSYVALILVVPDEAVKPHFCILFAFGLSVLGLIVAVQVRRVRALSRYYEGHG